MRTRFEAKFDKETGVSTVTIYSPIGQFTGIARLHPEDVDFASEIRGCTIAHNRASQKLHKERIKLLNAELKALKEIYSILSSMRDFNSPKGLSRIRREIKSHEAYISLEKAYLKYEVDFLKEYFNRMQKLANFIEKKNKSDKTE